MFDIIDDNLIKIEVGQFNTLRAVNLFKISEGENSSAFIASEFVLTDGVFESPQNFNRFNLFFTFVLSLRKKCTT